MTDADKRPWPIRLKRSPMRLLLVVGLRVLGDKGELRRHRVPASWRSPLEAQVGGLGVSLGSGVLEGEALVGVIALDRSASLIMVPVIAGRLAVAPASEDELLAALAAATRR